MPILFFDTETTGFRPGNICQLSYILVEGQEIRANNLYFKVDHVEPGAERVHGLSVKKLKELSNNQTFKDHILGIKKDFHGSKLLIAHNFSFDLGFIATEFRRCGEEFIFSRSLCTMKNFTNICKIPKANGYGYKWPRLEELTRHFKIGEKDIIKTTREIFNCDNTGYHDARFDTVATYLSYKKAEEQGLI